MVNSKRKKEKKCLQKKRLMNKQQTNFTFSYLHNNTGVWGQK